MKSILNDIIFGASNDQNEFHVISEWQKSPEISTLPIPNWAAQVCKNVNENGTIFFNKFTVVLQLCNDEIDGRRKKVQDKRDRI